MKCHLTSTFIDSLTEVGWNKMFQTENSKDQKSYQENSYYCQTSGERSICNIATNGACYVLDGTKLTIFH